MIWPIRYGQYRPICEMTENSKFIVKVNSVYYCQFYTVDWFRQREESSLLPQVLHQLISAGAALLNYDLEQIGLWEITTWINFNLKYLIISRNDIFENCSFAIFVGTRDLSRSEIEITMWRNLWPGPCFMSGIMLW